MVRVIQDELEIDVRMADPTLTRTITLPLAKTLLGALGERKLALAFERLDALFGTYIEWGQPIHDVGDDVKILALPARRPDTVGAFRMLCRHSRFVQEFGTVRDPDEIARRERLWGAGHRRDRVRDRTAGCFSPRPRVPPVAGGPDRPWPASGSAARGEELSARAT